MISSATCLAALPFDPSKDTFLRYLSKDLESTSNRTKEIFKDLKDADTFNDNLESPKTGNMDCWLPLRISKILYNSWDMMKLINA